MVDRRPKKQAKPTAAERSGVPDLFVEFGFSDADFDVQAGGGKSFLTGLRIVHMTIRHRASGREMSG